MNMKYSTKLMFLTFILPGWVFKFWHMVYDTDECYLTTKRYSCGLSPRANYTDRAAVAGRGS